MVLPRDAVILQLPVSHEEIRVMQGRQLLRYLMLSSDVASLQYYMGVALDCLKHVAPGTPAQGFTAFNALRRSRNVQRLRFGLLVALNGSTNFVSWVQKYSGLDEGLVERFCRELSVCFRHLVECTDSTGGVALDFGSVVYPTLDDFVMAVVRMFVRLQ
jgi:hypothetical protein